MVILVADDEAAQRATLIDLFKNEHEVISAENGLEVLQILEKTVVDVVITDNQMPKLTGLELIPKAKAIAPATSFILMTAFGTVQQAVEALKAGADDYVMKPYDLAEMEHRIRRVEEIRAWHLRTEAAGEARQGVDRLIGKSKAVQDARDFIAKVAKVPSPVLLLGPTGSGKEVVARAIHESGTRSSRGFIAVNCASLNEQLMESELFGHEKGAFTGAVASKPGKFELASGGTLFLDEVGELSPTLQAKLLRVLQEKELCRVGGVRTIKSDARVIAATHRPLKEMVKAGTFREDLFFRLNILTFELQPLANRREDLPALVELFLAELARELGRKMRLSKSAMSTLLSYPFPGNIRELKNALERLAVLSGDADEIGPELLPAEFHGPRVPAASASPGALPRLGTDTLTNMVDAFEGQLIQAAMKQSGNNQHKAAALLGIPRGTLQYKLKKYGLGDSPESQEAA